MGGEDPSRGIGASSRSVPQSHSNHTVERLEDITASMKIDEGASVCALCWLRDKMLRYLSRY